MNVDDIYERLSIITELPVEEIVAGTIADLPEDVAEFAVEKLIFFWPKDDWGLAFNLSFNDLTLKGFIDSEAGDGFYRVNMVYLSPDLFTARNRIEQRRTVAHEIAHHWLSHVHHSRSLEEFNRREHEVDEQLKAWGF